MTDKVKKDKIADILLEFYEEYQGNMPNRPMIPRIYASKIIDSMQEEPKDKCKGCNNVKGCITCVDGSEYAHIEECDITGIKSKEATGKLKECIDNITEEGLEEARKQLQELVNGGLDEEINRYIEQHTSEFSGYFFNLRRIAWHFANWQKQQMMKDAVDGKIYETQARSKLKATTTGKISGLKYRVGDEVKIIIIKEE